MADRPIFKGMFPLSTRQFSSAFLDFCRNRRGYADNVRTTDKDATKRLLSPASLKDNSGSNKCIPLCHPLGNMMWDFARQRTVMESRSRKQDTDPLRAYGWNSQRVNDYNNNVGGAGGYDDDDDGSSDSDNDDGDDDDDDDDDIANSKDSSWNTKDYCVVEQASHSKESMLSSTVLNEVENRNRVVTNVTLNNGLHIKEKNIHSKELLAYSPYRDNGISDFSNGQHLSDNSVSKNVENSNELLLYDKTEMIKPLPLYKQGKYNKRAILPSLTLNLKLEALNSVMKNETKLLRNGTNEDVDISGKVAILYGIHENESSHISVLESEVVGLYDYISGMVHIAEQHGCSHWDNSNCECENTKDPLQSSVNTFMHLSAFLEQHLHVSQASLTSTANTSIAKKVHPPVAWLLTSPALGVTLDWQVQENLHKLMQEWNIHESNDQEWEPILAKSKWFPPPQWCNVLVVVDEYRRLEKDISQIEVYKLCSGGIIKLMNFDLTE